MLTGSRSRLRRGLAIALAACAALLAIAGGAEAHGTPSGALGVKGVSEARLRAWETKVLGPEHAAEHARERAQVRRLRRALRNPRFKARYVREQRAARTKARKADVGLDPSKFGVWNGHFDIQAGGPDEGGVFGINAAMLPTGKVLWYSYPYHPDTGVHKDYSWAVLWDPGTGSFERVDPPIDTGTPGNPNFPGTGLPVNIWCSGTSFLGDGQVLVTGGNLHYIDATHTQFAGLNQVYTFDPWSQKWRRQPDMAHGRWYPSQLLMPDGRTIIIQGNDEYSLGDKNPDVEVFTPSPQRGGVGTITKVGTIPNQYLGDYYPHMFWMPSGKALVAGPNTNETYYFNSAFPTAQFGDVDDLSRMRTWGNAVLVPSQTPGTASRQVLALGGSNTGPDYDNAPATATSELFDEANAAAGWQSAPSWNIARSHANTVLLPDGSMVTVGGGVGSDLSRNRLWTANENQKQVELWNPATRTWTLGPSQLESRAYHSTAILLPDGRVLSAGDDFNGAAGEDGTRQDTAEIYEPAYLHKGPRPTLTQAPTAVDWNTDFTVATPDANVTRAVLVAPGAATHAVDMNQRVVPLTMTGVGNGTRTFRTPLNANVALPGYYMLFVLNDQGVPSIAKWVRLRPGPTENPVTGPGVPPTIPPTAPPTVPPSGGGSTGGSTGAGSGVLPGSVAHPKKAAKKPSVRATLVRRNGVRMIRVALGKSDRRLAKVTLRLRDRRGHTVRKATRSLRTGRTTTVGQPKVPSSARSASATVISVSG